MVSPRCQDDGFARLALDEAEVHLWTASDQSWKEQAELARLPVCSGAESFIAGTASCRIEVDHVDELYAETVAAAVLHPGDLGSAVDTAWGIREFAALDLEGKLADLPPAPALTRLVCGRVMISPTEARQRRRAVMG